MRRNRVRIIGGELRSRLVSFPDRLGLRPTPDRVRETLFNWLGQDLTGKTCLDLFAGSGALGFEAASRGAREVVMVERDAQAIRALADNARELRTASVQLVRADALEFLAEDARQFDVVFLDPPYGWSGREGLLPRVAPHLRTGGVVYLEAAAPLQPPPGWELWRHGKAGAAHYHLLRMMNSEQGSLSGNV